MEEQVSGSIYIGIRGFHLDNLEHFKYSVMEVMSYFKDTFGSGA